MISVFLIDAAISNDVLFKEVKNYIKNNIMNYIFINKAY